MENPNFSISFEPTISQFWYHSLGNKFPNATCSALKKKFKAFHYDTKKQVKNKGKVWVQTRAEQCNVLFYKKTYAEKNFDSEKATKGDSFDKKFVICYV